MKQNLFILSIILFLVIFSARVSFPVTALAIGNENKMQTNKPNIMEKNMGQKTKPPYLKKSWTSREN
jgi:hypothetical protein